MIGGNPKPMNVSGKIVSRATVGMARPRLATATIVAPPRRACPSQMPIGQATRQASATAAAEICRCSRVRTRMPSGLVQFNGSLSQTRASWKLFIGPAATTG